MAVVDVVEVVVFDVDAVAVVVLKEAPITTRDFRPPMFCCIVGTINSLGSTKNAETKNVEEANLGEIKPEFNSLIHGYIVLDSAQCYKTFN